LTEMVTQIASAFQSLFSGLTAMTGEGTTAVAAIGTIVLLPVGVALARRASGWIRKAAR